MTLDPVRMYDYLCRSRQWIFDRVRPLSAEDYTRAFLIGPGSLAKALTHIMISEWYYIARIEGVDVSPYPQWPIRDEQPPDFAMLEVAWVKQAEHTRHVLAAPRDWAAPIEYEVTDDGKRWRVHTNAADIATQLLLHEMHHRAQVINMLHQLGIEAEAIDFNMLTYERVEV